jgi:hypothetical protein
MNDLEILYFQLSKWQRLVRLQKATYWGIRGFLFGTLSSAFVSILLISQSRFLLSEYLTFLTISGILGLLLTSGITFFWPQSKITTARNYDRVFDLKERVSTAVELSQLEDVEQSWQELQLNDALEASRSLSPRVGLEWHIPKLEFSLLLVVLVLVLGTWFYGKGAFQQAEIHAKNHELIEAEIENLEELITGIQDNPQLSAEDTDAILSPLKESLNDLKEADSLEVAVSALSETQHMLEALDMPGNAEFAGLQAAGEELAKDADNPLNLTGEALKQGNLQEAAKNLASLALGEFDSQELLDLANQLMELAEQLKNVSPELSEQLQKVSEAIQNDELQAAQEAKTNASEALLESAQRLAANKAAQKSTEALADSQGRLMEAAMFAGMAQNNGVKTNSNDPPESEQKGSFGSQAGSGEFEESKTPGKEAGLIPLTKNNSPGESSEKQYDSVYAPQRLGGTSDMDLSIGSGNDTNNNTVSSVDTFSEQNAQSFVPYSEIFANYEGSMKQALDKGIIPLSLQPLIHDYFSSLDPR